MCVREGGLELSRETQFSKSAPKCKNGTNATGRINIFVQVTFVDGEYKVHIRYTERSRQPTWN